MAQALSVSQLTRRIKNTLEGDPGFQRLQVEGEIGNLTVHRSGHA
ncbi:MAG: exodeoxyribonuclease VII large subunit [Sphingobacteriia bacterium]